MFQSPLSFLIVNGVVVILLVAYFLNIKKSPSSSLNFKKKNASTTESAPHDDHNAVSLNVFFNYNGHSFDAYEVLGVPAGSTLAEIKEAYQKTLSTHDESSKPFYKAAYEAITKSQRA